MEPDRIDDADVLAAIERAWPIAEPATRLTARSFPADPPSDTGALAAPLTMPLARRNRHALWMRLAAVLALLVAGSLSVFAFDRNAGEPTGNSIAAPSAEADSCQLPLRTEAQVRQIVEQVKQSVADHPGDNDLSSLPGVAYSVYQLSADAADVASLRQFMDRYRACLNAGVNQVRIAAQAVDTITPQIAILFDQNASLTVDQVVNQIINPSPTTPVPSVTLTFRTSLDKTPIEAFTAEDGAILAVYQPDLYGNSTGYSVLRAADGWTVRAFAFVQGEWASLNPSSGSMGLPNCGTAQQQDFGVLLQYIANGGWLHTPRPLITTIDAGTLANPVARASSVRATAIDLLNTYRTCTAIDQEAYRLNIVSEGFFDAFAGYAGLKTSGSVNQLDQIAFNTVGPLLGSVVDCYLTSPDRMVVELSVNPKWSGTGKTPAVILIKQNGTWLIDQFAIVTPSSATPVATP